jgi:trimeric autotransporter adhesin
MCFFAKSLSLRGAWLAWGLFLLALVWTQPVRADAFGTVCAGCHSQPPTMLSQTPAPPANQYGKILPKIDDGVLDNSNACGTVLSCALRQKIVGNSAMGVFYATEAGVTRAELEEIRLYLKQVRDGVVAAPSPAPTFANTNVGSFVDSAFSFSVSNYRRTAFSYSLNITSAGTNNFSVQSTSLSGPGCAGTTVPATVTTTPATCTVNVTVRFQPTGPGTRTSTLKIALNAASVADPDANDTTDKSIALSGVGVALTGTVAAPASLPFGNVTVGTPSALSITVNNTGAGSINFSSFALGGTHPADFQVTGGTCSTVTPLVGPGSCTLGITFTPGAATARAATLTINSNASNPAVNVSLTGTGVAAALPVFSIGSSSLSFSTAPNAAVTSSTTITNSGTGTLSLSALAITGAFASDYTFAAGNTCTTSTALTAGLSCTLAIQFLPTAAGTRNASLGITHNAAGSPVAVALNGTATAVPVLNIGSSTLSFTTTANTAVTASTSITNTGTGTLNLSSLVISGAAASSYAFAASNTCTASTALTAGQTCTLALQLSPTTAGTYAASLAITHSAAGSPQNVALNGNVSAAPQPGIDLGGTTALSFGNVVVGNNAQQSITVLNNGSAALNISAFNITGTAASDFVRSGTCNTSTAVATSATCSVIITFTPSAVGARTASLAIVSNAPTTPTVSLSGTGTALAEPTVSPNPLPAFPATLLNTASSTPQQITISNPRAVAIVYSSGFGGTNAADFSITAESCPSRSVPANGGSCTVTLQFTPQAAAGAGARSGSLGLTFTGGAVAPLPQSVALSGTAAVAAPVFSVASSNIGFSAVVGASGTSSTTISNTGTAPLSLLTLSFGGSSGADYSLASGNTCTAGGSVVAGGSCSLVMVFTPGAAGSRPGTLSITHNAAGSPSVLNLNGIATASPQPTIDLSGVTALSFGSVGLGTSAQQSLTVRNIGAAPLNFSAFNLSGSAAAEFTRSGTCAVGTALAVNASCSLTLSFAPTAVGNRTAVLSISSDASNGTPAPTVALSGDGAALAEPVVSPLPLPAFPATLIGTTSATTQLLSIQNPRSSSLTYNRSFAGANAADFVVVAESCVSRVIPAGGNCALTLQFAPGASAGVGNRVASLSLSFVSSGADPNPGPVAVAVSGSAAAAAPVFSINSTALSFSTVLGNTATRSALVTNTGTATLVLGSLVFAGTSAAEFSLAASNTCTAGASIAPSNSCTLVLQYAPAVAGTSTASVAITHNAPNSPQSLALSGTTTTLAQARIEFSAFSALFPNTLLGSSSQQTITVQNTGGADLILSALTLGGSSPGDFSRAGTCSSTSVLLAGQQCSLLLTFQPTALGARSAALTLKSNASNGEVTLALTGAGVATPAAGLSLTPAGLDFGTQSLSGSFPARSVRLTNVGNAILNISNISVAGLGFSNVSATPCPPSLAPRDSCFVDIRFVPTTAGLDYTGSLSISSNAAGSPQVASLGGRGSAAVVPVLLWSPATARLDFGSVVAGALSATQSLTLLNQGPGTVTLNLLNAVGVDAQAFSATAGSCPVGAGTSLAQGQSCRVDVRFAPASAGSKTATVQVASTGSAPPELNLLGTGLGGASPGLAVSETTVNFELTRVGAQSLPATVTLMGSGSGVVRINSISVSSGFVMQNKTCPAAPFTLPAGAECTVTVSFLPQGEGLATGSLTINTDATPAQRSVALSAQAEPKADVSGGGGCSISKGDSTTDPTLWALVLLAAAVLWRRRRVRGEHHEQLDAGR